MSKGRISDLAGVLGQWLHPNRVDDVLKMASGDPAVAAKLAEAAGMDDGGRQLRTVLFDLQRSRAPAKPAAEPPAPRGGSRDPVPLEQRIANDPKIQTPLQEGMDSLPPELQARIRSGDTEAMAEGYRTIVDQRSKRKPRAKKPKTPEDQIRELRQQELPLGDPEPRGLIPVGVRGPGVPVGGVAGPGSRVPQPTGLIPAPLRGIPGESRALSTDVDLPRLEAGRGLSTDVELDGLPGPRPRYRVWQEPPRRIEGPNPLLLDDAGSPQSQFDRAAAAWTPTDPVPPPRNASPGWRALAGQAASDPRVRTAAKAAVGAAGIGAGIYLQGQLGDAEIKGDLTETGDTAELAAEQRPLPETPPAPPRASAPPTKQADPDPASLAPEPEPQKTAEYYFGQARELIDRLNQMRRNAGGEVPEAPQMMAEIRRLQDIGNQMRNSPSWQPTDTGDPHQQAQMLIRDLNERRRRAGGEVPEAPQIMAEVRRLQAMGDAQRNSGYQRTGDMNVPGRRIA